MMSINRKIETRIFQENLFTIFLEKSIARFCEWNLPWSQRSIAYEKKLKLLTKDICENLVNEIFQSCPNIYHLINNDKSYCDKLSISLLSTRLIPEETVSQLSSSILNTSQNLSNLSVSISDSELQTNNLAEFIQTWLSHGRLKLPPSLIPEKTYQILLKATLNRNKNQETYHTLCNHIILSLALTQIDSKIIEEIIKDQTNRFEITPIPWKSISTVKVQNYLNHVVANNL